MRVCKVCDEPKSITEFHISAKRFGKIYYRHKCKECYGLQREARRHRIRTRFKQLKKTLKCEQCGNDDYRVLEFDHKDRSKKELTISVAASCGFGFDKILKEIQKCQVLCANCHRIKTWNENHPNG